MSTESSYLKLPSGRIYNNLYEFYLWVSAMTNPVYWVMDKRTKTVLDVGCGQGYPMQLLKMLRPEIKATGVDKFKEYLNEAKKLGFYEKLILSDVRKLSFKDKSFDTVICLQVIEHLSKDEGVKLLKKLERIARYQVIVTTPLGYIEHPDMDHNELQKHLSGWDDEDFKKLGFKIKHQSLNFFFGEDGLVHKNFPKLVKGGIFMLDKLMMPLFFLFPLFSDYWIIAYKKVS